MIPQVLHRIWLGPLRPPIFDKWWRTWAELHPGWALKTWTEPEIEALGLQNKHLFDRAEELTEGNPWQLRSDVARYEILLREGGIYVDCDTEPLKPLEPLLVHEAFAAWEIQNRFIGNSVLGSVPNHPAFRSLVEGLPDSVAMNRGAVPAKTTGPQFVTRVWGFTSVTLLPEVTFYPYRWNELQRGHEVPSAACYARHHWSNQRRKRGVPL